MIAERLKFGSNGRTKDLGWSPVWTKTGRKFISYRSRLVWPEISRKTTDWTAATVTTNTGRHFAWWRLEAISRTGNTDLHFQGRYWPKSEVIKRLMETKACLQIFKKLCRTQHFFFFKLMMEPSAIFFFFLSALKIEGLGRVKRLSQDLGQLRFHFLRGGQEEHSWNARGQK